MIDETGKKAWEETFDLWGKPHDHLETRVVGGAILTNVKPREETTHPEISQPFLFPGQYHDEETGLYYNRYRYYMPNEGMYTQRDPIGLAGGNPTVYGYVRDTNIQIDPFGLWTFYQLIDKSENIIYQGITDRFEQRMIEHARGYGNTTKKSFVQINHIDNLTRVQARNLEGSSLNHAKRNGLNLMNRTKLNGRFYHDYDPKNLKQGRKFLSEKQIEHQMNTKGKTSNVNSRGEIICPG